MTQFLAFLLLFIFTASYAQAEPRSAMSYTTVGTKQKQEDPKHLRLKTVKSLQDIEEKKDGEMDGILRDVWDRYQQMSSAPEQTESKPSAAAQAQEQPKTAPSGLAGILQTYRQNKDKRSDMRTIEVIKPEKPLVEKPKAPKVDSSGY